MYTSTGAEVGVPSFDDFEVIKETLFLMGKEPDCLILPINKGLGLIISLERLFSDLDSWAWPPLTICLAGLLNTSPRGNRMLIRYQELAHNTATENSSVNHDYSFATEGAELVEFGQSIYALPEILSPRQEAMTDNQMNQAADGMKILRVQLGDQLEISAGDCGVLFDRMLNLIG